MPAQALTMLFDFETDEQIQRWTIRSARQDTFKASPQYATSGKRSVVFRSPKWRKGMPEWPAFEVGPPVKDWSKARALLIDLTNPTDTNLQLKLFITDSDTPFRQGASAQFPLAPKSHHRALIPLARFPKSVNRSDVAVLHFFTTRPEADYVVHLDTIALLAEGEAPPGLPPAYAKQLVRLMVDPKEIPKTKAKLDALQVRVNDLVPDQSAARPWFVEQLNRVRAAWQTAEAAYHAGTLTPQQAAGLRDGLQQQRTARLESLANLLKAWREQGGSPRQIVGVATSMEKVLPRELPIALEIDKNVCLELARNETEAFQIIVVPLVAGLKGVHVELGDLVSEAGARLPAKSLDVRVVGYVKTAVPPYAASHVGWWPDPLLDFLTTVDVEPGDAQAFWVRVRAPKGAVPGTYRGKIRITSATGVLAELVLDVRVYGFAVPDRSPLPTAISVYTQYTEKFAGKSWETLKTTWADYLADYYIDYDSLYRRGAPDFDILKRLDEQGRLVAFNLRYFHSNVFHPKRQARRVQPALLPQQRVPSEDDRSRVRQRLRQTRRRRG
jgi:hypothetical protein